MTTRKDNDGNIIGIYSHIFGKYFDIDEWRRKIRGNEDCIDRYNGFIWNRNEVCTNPRTAVLVSKNGCSLKIRVGECRFGWVASYDYNHKTGGASSPTMPVDDNELYESEYDAVTALLRSMIDAGSKDVNNLAKIAYADYTSRNLQLSLF